MTSRLFLRAAASCLSGTLYAIFALNSATAAEIDFGVSAGVGRSDNVTRTAEDEIEETIAAVGTGVSLDHQSRRLTALALGSLAYLKYLDDTYDDELIGNLLAEADLEIVPERLRWVVQDNFGQTRQVSTDPVTPDNRENFNYLTTGPDLTLPLGLRTSLLMSGRFSDVYYEDSDLGSEELFGSVAIVRALSRESSLSLNGSVERTEQDNALLALDYDEYEAYLSYQLEAARTTLVFDAGYTELHFDDLTSDGYLVRLELIRRLTPSSALTLAGGREFSNSADIFRQLQQQGGTDTATQPVQAIANPFESTYGSIEWAFERNRTTFGFGAGYFEEDYELSDTFNRDRVAYYVTAGRELSRTLGVRAHAGYADESYSELDREFSETTAEFYLDWRLGRHVYTSLQYRWIDRGDDVAANEFDESQIWLLFGYSRLGRGSRIGGTMLPTMGQGGR
jgi:Putative beta-barrel porin 2